MKLGVSLYSFHKYAADRDAGVRECIKKAAEMGFSGLDFVEVGLEYNQYLDYAAGIRQYCNQIGITPICFCTSAEFLRCDDINEEIKKVKRNVDIAAAYGCPILRHDISRGFESGDGREYRHAVEIVAPAVREITLYAKEKGIVTTTENHGFFSQDSDRVEMLISAVDDDNFGALVDVGNFSCADENNVSATERLAKYARHAHVKDFYIKENPKEAAGDGWFSSRGGKRLLGAAVGYGDIPVFECIKALQNAGYDQYLTIEYEGQGDPIEGISLGAQNLKQHFIELL